MNIFSKPPRAYLLNGFFLQFFHHPWNGLRFWDLIQPSFMFMAGVAMAFSLHKQAATGNELERIFYKTLRRCGWLFFWGVLDYAVRPGDYHLNCGTCLTQLSFTTLGRFSYFPMVSSPRRLFLCGILIAYRNSISVYTCSRI